MEPLEKLQKILCLLVWVCFACTQWPSKIALARIELPVAVDQDVCFSPKGNCDIKLIQFVQSAKKSIAVAIYAINLDDLVQVLVSQAKKMPVRVIVDKSQAHGKHSLVRKLIQSGVNVRYGRQHGIFHNKFIIVDQQRMETGSFNYTNNAARNNSENQIYINTPSIIAQYQRYFEDLWKNARYSRQ